MQRLWAHASLDDGQAALADAEAEAATGDESNHVDAPRVERQIAELASDVFAVLGKRLAERGHDIDARHLGEMYVHVELDSGVPRTPFRTPA